MIFLPAAIGTFLLVNLLCACIALGVGFAAGVWFFGSKLAKPTTASKKKPVAKPNTSPQRAAERAALATSRVADLAQNVACDVGEHAAKMKAISADLEGIDRDGAGAGVAVFAALDQMLAANTELQQRLEQAEKQLATQAAEIRTHESEARTDSLTGIANRRAFDDELKRRLSEWDRKNVPCSLVLMDIDFFKKFNDTHGHQVGDEVLRSVAKVLKQQSRDMDLPCRYGGEEFAVILPSTDAAPACIVAERIRKAIEDSTTLCEGKSLKVTCSIGLSAFGRNDDVAQLIRRADEGLYASKKAGRNCGHWNNSIECVPITKSLEALLIEKSDATSNSEDEGRAATSTHVGGRATSASSFIHKLKRRVTESHRFGIPLSVMHLKIEEFEVINQKYGSPIARQLVEAAVPALEKGLREMDLLARLENGEFVIMLPGNTLAEAGQLAKRLRMGTKRCVLPLVDRDLQLRLREGIAELKAHETAQELLSRARQIAITLPEKAHPLGV